MSAHDKANCTHTPEEHEMMQELFEARMALGRAATGKPYQAIVSAVGLLITDLHESATKQWGDEPELLNMLNDLIRGVGEKFVNLAGARRNGANAS